MDEIEIDPPSSSQQAVVDSSSEAGSVSSLSTPSTPLNTSAADNATAASESVAHGVKNIRTKTSRKKQKLPPHGGKCVYYGCEKCQHMSLNRAAFNAHVITCYGKTNTPRDDKVIEVRAVRFEKTPVLGTCIYCERYTHCVGSILLCHEYVCGERQWRGEVGDPPYVPPIQLWVGRGRMSRTAPREYLDILEEFKRGGTWEPLEREYLQRKRLDHLLPVERECTEVLPLPKNDKPRPTSIFHPDKKVVEVRPQPTLNRRRYKGRLVAQRSNPCYEVLMGSVYSVKRRCIVGHMVVVGEPRFGMLTLEPYNEANDKVTVFHQLLGTPRESPIRRPLAATIVLFDVKTGKPTSIMESADNPRHWETDYTILSNVDYGAARCPGISVTYTEVPTELLKLFSADHLSPIGLTGRN